METESRVRPRARRGPEAVPLSLASKRCALRNAGAGRTLLWGRLRPHSPGRERTATLATARPGQAQREADGGTRCG